MASSTHCEQCKEPLRESDTVCPRCGRLTTVPADARPGAMSVAWTDGSGQVWQIEADPSQLTLTGETDRFEFARSEWKSIITFAPTGSKVVIHIDTRDREIGFMVPLAEARRLFAAMGRQAVGAEAPPPPGAAGRLRVVGAQRQGPTWPKMRAMPVVALFFAALAFLPVIGALFALVAIILAAVALRKSRDNLAYLHARVMAKVGIIMAAAGLGICALGTYSLLQQDIDESSMQRLFGVPVDWGWGAGVAAIVMVIIALSIHEAAHAITAWWFGDGYARSCGRVTLNPLAHIDPFGTVLLPLMLAWGGLPIFGYARPVPVQLGALRRYRLAHILISAAGPASNLLQAAICMALLVLIGSLLGFAPDHVVITNYSSLQPMVEIEGLPGGRVLAAVVLMLKLGFQVNLMLAFFNLIPIPPLDGSWIAQHLSPTVVGRFYATIRPYGFLIFLGLLFTGVLETLMWPGVLVMLAGLFMLTLVTGL